MNRLLIVKADPNDADYIYESTMLSEEAYQALRPLLEKVASALKDCTAQHNWPEHERADQSPEGLYAGILTEEEVEKFREYVPSDEYGVHTIYAITVHQVLSTETLFS
jgi:hypothetical protein